MSQALPLPALLSQSTNRTRKYRVLSATFGDGYSQEAPDGINATFDEWAIVYENISTTDRTTIWAALDSVGASDYFTWTPNGDATSKKFKVTKDGIKEQPLSNSAWNISFTLRQVF